MADSENGEKQAIEKSTSSAPPPANSVEPVPGVLLPPLPSTGSPIELKQQINVYQIPQNAWDRLNQEQTMELTKMILEQADSVDKRHFEFAMEKAKHSKEGKKLAIILGSAITIVGYAGAALLAFYGHEIAAVSISLPITTILAMVIGNRFLD